MVQPHKHYPHGVNDGDEQQKPGVQRFHLGAFTLGQKDGKYCQGEAEEKASRVSHEYPCLREVVPKEPAEGPYQHKTGQSYRRITRQDCRNPHEQECDERYSPCQTVQAIDEVDSVRDAYDSEECKGNAHDPKIEPSRLSISTDLMNEDIPTKYDN